MNGERATDPLYSILDTLDCCARFGRSADYGRPIELVPGLTATFYDAGHILGSASILLEMTEGGRQRSILFSGDIGNENQTLLRRPQTPADAEIVVMETTYGDRCHRSFSSSVEELEAVVTSTLLSGGNVLIPTFALERTQEILCALRRGIDENRLPPSLPVFLDSPMAISATEIFRRHPTGYAPALRVLIEAGKDPFSVPNLHLARDRADSVAINRISGGAVIMAGSGMCTGGRIRHHLLKNLSRPEASIVFVGFAARNTLARRIIDGARTVRIFDEQVPVRARIHTINGFSAHADQRELLQWHAGMRTRMTFLVHGELSAMQSLGGKLRSSRVEMPCLGQQFEL